MTALSIDSFIKALQGYHSDTAFNPWADYDPQCDIGPQAPLIRAANLKRYLTLRQKARFLFIAEGLGYQGGHFSGMAMTSERILLGHHPNVRPHVVLGEDYPCQRTSNPESPLLNRMQREKASMNRRRPSCGGNLRPKNWPLSRRFCGIFIPSIPINHRAS